MHSGSQAALGGAEAAAVCARTLQPGGKSCRLGSRLLIRADSRAPDQPRMKAPRVVPLLQRQPRQAHAALLPLQQAVVQHQAAAGAGDSWPAESYPAVALHDDELLQAAGMEAGDNASWEICCWRCRSAGWLFGRPSGCRGCKQGQLSQWEHPRTDSALQTRAAPQRSTASHCM